MAGLTGIDTDVAADLTLPATMVEPKEHGIQNRGMAGPDTGTPSVRILLPPVHHPRAAR